MGNKEYPMKSEPQNIEYRTPNVEVKKAEAKAPSTFGVRSSIFDIFNPR